MMVTPFDSEEILTEQIEHLKEERKKIDDYIKKAEALLVIGTDPNIVDMFVNKEKLDLMGVNDISEYGIEEDKWEEMLNILDTEEKANVDKIFNKIWTDIKTYINDSDKLFDDFQQIVEIYQRNGKGFVGVIFLSIMRIMIVGNGIVSRAMFDDLTEDDVDKYKQIVENAMEKIIEQIMDIAAVYLIRIGKLYRTEYTIESVKSIMKKMNEAISKKYRISDEICIINMRNLMLLVCNLMIKECGKTEEELKFYRFIIEMFKEHYDCDLLSE